MKHNYDKSKFLESLSGNPWISSVAKKTGISRATIYRWMKDNPDFKRAVVETIKLGHSHVGEMAEIGLAKKIQEGYWPAIKFELEHTNPRYVPKRSEYVFPPNHIHYDGSDRCERCGRLSSEVETERKERVQQTHETLTKLATSKTAKDKKEVEKLLKQVLEDSKKRKKQ